MNTPITPLKTLQTQLAELANLSAFATQSGIARRTLINVRDGAHAPSKLTLMGIEAALKKYKPAKKPVEPVPEE